MRLTILLTIACSAPLAAQSSKADTVAVTIYRGTQRVNADSEMVHWLVLKAVAEAR